MSYIYWLSQIQHPEQSLVGEQFFVLSQLLQRECPVLPGFVLDRELSSLFLADLELKNLLFQDLVELPQSDNDRYLALQAIARRSQQTIEQATFNPKWLTEISAAAQQLNADSLILQPDLAIFKGQHPEFQHFWHSPTCDNHPQAIAKAIKQIWSELFTASGLLLWNKLGFSLKDLALSILIRPLPKAYASGIIEFKGNIIRIQANWGLEQSLVRGEVKPDEYYVDESTGHILARHLGHKNYAYQPRSSQHKAEVKESLVSYIPAATDLQTYVLDGQAIAKLLQLTQVVLDRQPQIKYLVWTALATENRALPNFYFTQFSFCLPQASILFDEKIATRVPLSSIPPLLNGVAAAAGKVVAKTLIIANLEHHHAAVTADRILVTKTILPQHIHLIKQAGGIITETGGKTSHGAIIARELNIPAIVNAVDATKILQHGTKVFLNGDEGKVYPAAAHSLLHHDSSNDDFDFSQSIATKLMVNLSQPESIARSDSLPVDGVGLLRSELMLAELLTPRLLSQGQEAILQTKLFNTLTDALGQFCAAFAPRPVFYRSIDYYGQDNFSSILGDRGTYSYLSDPSLFYGELEALATVIAEGHTNLNLILPFVRSVEEFKFCYRAIENIGLTSHNSFQVWIMAEVPSVVLLLPEYIRAGVQGITIGTNDLTQLLLGVDREQAEFSDRGLNANHPAMQQAIAQLIAIAKANDIGCCICGQAPVDYPELIDKLIAWGIDTISVEPEAVAKTYRAIARAEKRMLLDNLDCEQISEYMSKLEEKN